MEIKVRLSVITLTLLLTSCGSANVNRIFGNKDESTKGLLESALAAYDRGDLDDAETYAKKAYSSNHNNGEAAILLGNIMMSKSGVDIFQLVGKLAEMSDSKTSTSTSTKCPQSEKDAAGSVSRLSCLLLNLSDDDIAALGTDVTLTSPGLKSLGSYYKPALVDETLREKVSVLKYANEGIRYLCPFIDRDLVLTGSIDERHLEANCADRTATDYNAPKAHIAFALLHLVETLVYQRSIVVDSESAQGTSGKVGVTKIGDQFKSVSTTSVADFVTTMEEFETVVDALADTTSNKSQIALAIDSFIITANSFVVAGMPAKVVSTITGGLTKLRETASKLSQASGSSSENYLAQAFKGQITQKTAQTTTTKINEYCEKEENASGCQSNKTQICQSYTGISEGVDTSKVSVPTICQ